MDLLPGETILFDQPANWIKGPLVIGGRLVVTDQRLLFIPYEKFISHTAPLVLDLRDVVQVEYTNSFFFIPNGIMVTVISGEKYKFIVWFRRNMIRSIHPTDLQPLTSE